MLSIRSLRLRLTFLSAALVGLALTVMGTALYFYFASSSYTVLDSELREQAAQVTDMLNKQQMASGQAGALNLPATRLDSPEMYVQLLALDGTVIGRSANLQQNTALPVSPAVLQSVLDQRQAVTTGDSANGMEMRLLYAPLTAGNTATVATVIQVATPVAPVSRQLDQLRLILLATGALALALVGLGAWWTTGRALKARLPVPVG